MLVIGQSQHVAGPAIITIVLQAACCETDPGSQPARCHLAPNKVSHVLPWGFGETGLRNFKVIFLFFRLILAVWAQYQMLGYYVFNMIWIPLRLENCSVCICHGRAQLGFAHHFVKPSRKKQFMLTQGALEPISEHGKHWLHYLLLPMHGVWAGDAEQGVCELCFQLWAELSPALETGWQVTGMTHELSRGKAVPCLRAWHHRASSSTGEGGSSLCSALPVPVGSH